MAREFERAGLKPAGTDGYFQPVRLISREIDEAHSSLTLDQGFRRRGTARPGPAMRSSARGSSRPRRSRPSWSSPAMGCRSPKPITTTSPAWTSAASWSSSWPAHRRRSRARWPRTCSRPASVPLCSSGWARSASSCILNPKNMDIPWERSSLARFMPSMSLADPALDERRGPEARRHDQPGPCRQAARRLGPHVSTRSSKRPTPASRCRTSPSRPGSRRRPP